jgi:hypothetical protein
MVGGMGFMEIVALSSKDDLELGYLYFTFAHSTPSAEAEFLNF